MLNWTPKPQAITQITAFSRTGPAKALESWHHWDLSTDWGGDLLRGAGQEPPPPPHSHPRPDICISQSPRTHRQAAQTQPLLYLTEDKLGSSGAPSPSPAAHSQDSKSSHWQILTIRSAAPTSHKRGGRGQTAALRPRLRSQPGRHLVTAITAEWWGHILSSPACSDRPPPALPRGSSEDRPKPQEAKARPQPHGQGKGIRSW